MNKKKSRLKPYKKNDRFYNNHEEQKSGFAWHTMYMLLGSLIYRVGDLFKNRKQWHSYQVPIARSVTPAVTWIGHSTFLLQIEDINILLDPLFGNASPLFRRIFNPGIELKRLPEPDIILISHNHLDHMERSVLMSFKKNKDLSIMVPFGLGSWFESRGFTQAREFDWWDHYEVHYSRRHVSINITFLPARHWSQRSVRDKNVSLWGSWMIECNGHTIYFAGDTTYSDHFKVIAAQFPKIDIAFLPIAPCEPHRLLHQSHMNAEQAGNAFCDLNAHTFIPMHWGTFHFGVESFDLPINRLCSWWQTNSYELTRKKLAIFKIGQRLAFEKNC